MTKTYYAYIDEAGDEGFGKLGVKKSAGGGQSQWLVLGGFIVASSNNRMTARWRDSIKAIFPTGDGPTCTGPTSGTSRK